MDFQAMLPYIAVATAVTTILIVISGLIITLKQLNLKSKEAVEVTNNEIISRNRQAWINTLRDELSNFIGLVHYTKGFDYNQGDDKISLLQEATQKIQKSQSKINLLINPKEEKHRNLILLCAELTLLVSGKAKDDKKNYSNIVTKQYEFTTLSQNILKEEWERVKKFDKVYRVNKPQAFFPFIGIMFIKLVTIVTASLLFMYYINIQNQEILDSLIDKLDWMFLIFTIVLFSILFGISQCRFKDGSLTKSIFSTAIETSYNTIHVAYGYILSLAIYNYLHADKVDYTKIITLILIFIVLWFFVVLFGYIFNYLLKNTNFTKIPNK